MKARTLRHIVCGLTLTGATLAGLFADRAYGVKPTPTPTPTATPFASINCPPPPGGTALITPPAGGFALDGNLQANTTVAGVGDWLPTPSGGSGSGGFVLNNLGAPVTSTTFHLIDPFSAAENNFAGGQKVDDNPNVWTWVTNPVNNKQDINNALIHFGTDANGHNWVIVSGDRLSTNGNAYIDFEFLQNTLSLTTIPGSNPAAGGFSSAGTAGGRTVNDFILTLTFTNGGTTPGLCLSRWTQISPGSFDYVDATSLLPAGAVFAAVNTGTIPVPYGAFGNTTYPPNAFAEAGIDLTALLNNFGNCVGVGIKTIFVKTKESQSNTATIVDFIAPLQVNIRIGPTASAGADQTKCSGGPSGTTFNLNGTATSGANPIVSMAWSVVSGTATIDPPSSCSNCTTLPATVHVTSASATLRLTATDSANCVETDDVVLTVNNNPTCSISGPLEPLCPNSTGNSYSGPAGASSYAWSITGNGAIVGSSTGQSVTVTAGSLCGSTFTLTLNLTDANGCMSTCMKTVAVDDATAPVISCPADKVLACGDSTLPANTGTATATDNCGGTPTISFTDAATSANCTGKPGIDRTWKAVDSCNKMSTCVQHITFADSTPPVITVPAGGDLGCNPAALPTDASVKAQVTATDNCGGTPTINVSHGDGGTACAPTRTFTVTATDNCSNTSQSKTVVYSWKADTQAPVINASGTPSNGVLGCNPTAAQIEAALGTAMASDNCGAPTLGSSTGNVVANGCSRSQIRTWTATDACTNAATPVSRTVTWTVDTTPPVITATGTPSDGTLGCNPTAAQIEAALGTATAADDCGNVTPTASTGNLVVNGCSRMQTRTWNATDACTNAATAVSRTATWTVDTAAPVITLSGGKQCGGSENQMCPNGTPTFPTAMATDNCDGDLGQPLANPNPVPTTGPAFFYVDTTPAPNTFVRTWTAIDSCGGSGSTGHTTTCKFTVMCGCTPLGACTPPYPFSSSNPKTNIAFNESTVLRAFTVSVNQTSCLGTIQLFYNDEHALTLGVNKVSVKTTSGTTTTNCDVTPLPSDPGSATNPNVGLTSGGNPSTTCASNDVDVSGRPMYPALFITDVTSCAPVDCATNASANPSCCYGGDWQFGGTGIPPSAVFGTWKAAAKTVDNTHNPPAVTVTPGTDPAKNNWSLGPGSDPLPSPTPSNEGYGAEARWDLAALKQAGLFPAISGHQYRFYFMVHDGDQNKSGGDSGQGCTFLTAP
jgi:hypothetical protein